MAVLKADPAFFRLFVGALFAVGALMLFCLEWVLPEFLAYVRAQEPARASRLIQGAFLVLALPLAAGAVYAFRYGGRIIASGRSPPPGARVLRDTEILEGERAHLDGLRYRGLGMALLAGSVLMGLFLPAAFAP